MNLPTDSLSDQKGTAVISIDNLVNLFSWIKWTNIILLSFVITLPSTILSSLLKGESAGAILVAIGAAFLAFPAWIAWKNINVIHSVTQRYTIRTLLFVACITNLFGSALILGGIFTFTGRDKEAVLVYGAVMVLFGILPFGAALAILRLRKKTVPILGVRLDSLVRDIENSQSATDLIRPKPEHPTVGWMLIFGAFCIWTAGDFIPTDSLRLQDAQRIINGVSQFAFILVLLARSYFQPTANTILSTDRRKPILLLRSFIDDEKINWNRSDVTFFDTSLESRLVSQFSLIGPFIAVGAPAEGVPVIGAARAKLSDDEWQDWVRKRIDQSALILMMSGITRWVDWELQQIIARGAVNKLIICFPPMKKRDYWWNKKFSKDMNNRLQSLRYAFTGTPWFAALDKLDDAKTLRSIVLKDEGGITVVRAKSRDRNAYHLAVLIAQSQKMAILAAPVSAVRVPQINPPAIVYIRELWVASATATLLSVFCLLSGMTSDWSTILFPLGLASALFAMRISPFFLKTIVDFNHSALVKKIISIGILILVVHSGMLVALTMIGEILYKKDLNSSSLAISAFKYPAYAGLKTAQHYIAAAHFSGTGVPENQRLGCELFRRPAQAGFEFSKFSYGICLSEGIVNSSPGESAIQYLIGSANSGNVTANVVIGDAYLLGKNVSKDVPRALPYYEKAAFAGHVGVARLLGKIYSLGAEGVPVQYDKARIFFETAVKLGDSESMYQLGNLIWNGLGVSKSKAVAVQYYEQAATAGNHSAQLVFGLMLLEGEDVSKNIELARSMLKASLATDNAKARELAEEGLREIARLN